MKIIEVMINNIIQISKINGRLLPPITTLLALKQADNFSLILFDIFFDDVVEIFDDSCNPIKLHNGLSINHLLYADDMAILSLSSDGLQNSLNRLHMYCNKWKIEICTVKTKSLIFNTSGNAGINFIHNHPPRDKPPGHDLKRAKTLPPGQNRESKAPPSGHKVSKFHKCTCKL